MSTVIFLHGASSSGKSTLATAIRAQADTPFVHLSIDHFRDSGAVDMSSYTNWPQARTRVFSGFHRAIAGFANAGNDLIIEHILDTAGWHADLQTLLANQNVLFVGLLTPLAELAKREEARGDRPFGSAKQDFHSIHKDLAYDLELNGTAHPKENAVLVLNALAAQKSQSTFFI